MSPDVCMELVLSAYLQMTQEPREVRESISCHIARKWEHEGLSPSEPAIPWVPIPRAAASGVGM